MLPDQTWLNLLNEGDLKTIGVRRKIEQTVDFNQLKVLQAFRRHRVSDFHLNGSTGYGYNDSGRETIDAVYADVFGAESALVRPHMVSGTHAISVALFGILRPGDELLFITGKPYDTLQKVIGESHSGSLADWGITAKYVDLLSEQTPDFDRIKQSIHQNTKVIAIQRSRGYEWRPAFSIAQISEMIRFVKSIRSDLIVFVDNCYGEFTEQQEPTEVGADLMAGSLIKNPGGGIASTGGYIVGRKSYVSQAAYRLTAPGIGGDVGAMLDTSRHILQGLFLAPHIVGQALQGAVFAAYMFEKFGLLTHPKWHDQRTDLIQAVKFDNRESLLKFVQTIQHYSPIDSHVSPEGWNMPGYESPVIMAAGTFVQGGSLELSADAPIREPYIAYMQGGLTYSHVKWSVMFALSKIFGQFLDK